MKQEMKEELAFSAMMTVGMVIIMLAYNMIIALGFSVSALLAILGQFVPIFIAAFVIEQLVVNHNVHKLHKIIISPDDSEFKHIIVMSILMATCMSLLMTLYTSLIYFGTGVGFWQHYIITWLHNYPVALIAQLVIVGPSVRLLHLRLFKKPIMVD